MLEELKVEGVWWIPGQAAEPAPGVLELGADRFELELDAPILDRPSPGPGTTTIRVESVKVPVIHGTTDHGDVTLLEARALVSSHDTGFEEPPSWWPRMLLVGSHLDEHVTFEKAMLRTDHLDEWACTPSLPRDIDRASNPSESVSFSAERAVIDGADVEGLGLVELIAVPVWSATRLTAEVALQAVVRITPELPLHLHELMERVEVVRSFIRIGVGAPTALVEANLTPKSSKTSVAVHVRSIAFGGKPPPPVKWHQMIVARPDLSNGLGAALAGWAKTRRHHEQAWFRLCATDHLQLTNTDEAFVAYAKAIEALHEGDFEKTGAAEAASEVRIIQTLEFLPDDLAEWAEPVLRKNANPPTARHRVLELVESMGDLGDDLTGGNPDDFAQRVIATRNGLTHIRSKRRANYLFDSEARCEFGRALHYLGFAYLLSRAGVPLEHLTARFRTQPEVSTVIARVGQYERLWADGVPD